MDTKWAKEKLIEYCEQFDEVDQLQNYDWYQASALDRLTPTVLKILRAVGVRVQSVENFGYPEFLRLKSATWRGIGVLDDWGEIENRLKPIAPNMSADQLHPWVWDAARTFWQSRHYRAAVQTAATAINAHLQDKVGRRDISDDKLIGRCFSENPPDSSNPRLRVKGDQSDPTIQSLQRGAGQLGFACFWAIRNPATHETGEWAENFALEQLATLSFLARIIDECDVITV
ncbi:TIGR02391 family protein [Actinosynnema sp. NPDC023587]|uniref:TIGR02391 family protein n=1 Tax=Actinosynnema sp. NPDC023587 TaxID=3154695 RepID=UPI0033EE9FA1